MKTSPPRTATPKPQQARPETQHAKEHHFFTRLVLHCVEWSVSSFQVIFKGNKIASGCVQTATQMLVPLKPSLEKAGAMGDVALDYIYNEGVKITTSLKKSTEWPAKAYTSAYEAVTEARDTGNFTGVKECVKSAYTGFVKRPLARIFALVDQLIIKTTDATFDFIELKIKKTNPQRHRVD